MSDPTIKILIADDEEPARKRLKSLLENHKSFQIVAEAQNGDEVLRYIIEKTPDAAFLDINMPGASVFSTIPSLKNPPLVIFQTAYSEYAAKAFDIDAVDYLMKPVSRDRFNHALEKLTKQLLPTAAAEEQDQVRNIEKENSSKDVISIKTGESLRVLKISHIKRISFEEGFSFIHYGGEKLYSDRPLSYFEDLLMNNRFYRTSRTDLINLKFLEKLHPFFNGQYIAELTGGEKISVSRRRVQGLKARI